MGRHGLTLSDLWQLLPWEVAAIIRGRHRQARDIRERHAELAAWIWTGDIHLDPKPVTLSPANYPNAEAFLAALQAHQRKQVN